MANGPAKVWMRIGLALAAVGVAGKAPAQPIGTASSNPAAE